MKILISARGKTKLVEVPEKTHALIAVLKIFYPPDTPVKLGAYRFRIKEINPWPPPENVKLL